MRWYSGAIILGAGMMCWDGYMGAVVLRTDMRELLCRGLLWGAYVHGVREPGPWRLGDL